jgi:hypothetical protein
MNLGDRVGQTASPTTTVPGSTQTTTPSSVPAGTTPAQLLAQAQHLFDQADAALAQSPPDFATYQAKQAQARALVEKALAAING